MMEIVYLIAALGAACLCVFCYERGIKAGKALREVRTTERISGSAAVTIQETVTAIPEAAKTEMQEEKDFDKAYRNWQGYEPKYPGVKE